MKHFVLALLVIASIGIVSAEEYDHTIYNHLGEWQANAPTKLPGPVATLFGDENVRIDIIYADTGEVDMQVVAIIKNDTLTELEFAAEYNESQVFKIYSFAPGHYEMEDVEYIIAGSEETLHELVHSEDVVNTYREYKSNGKLEVRATTFASKAKLGFINTMLWFTGIFTGR